jgi:stalled ribosome rescue protein Dom34
MANLKLNDELIKKAHFLISEGHYAIVVCSYLGISEKTYYEWTKQGKNDNEKNKESIFSKFFQSIKEAEAKAEIRHIQTIARAASEGTWQASAWFLERKHKDRWSQKQDITLSGNPDAPLEIRTQWGE